MPKPPRLSRTKLTGLGLALGLYLSGVLLLSAVSLREPKGARAVTMSDGTLAHRNRGNNAQTVKIRRPPLRWCSVLRYKDPWEAKPIALASFPGSGNTWIRYLLQQATGYHTGSVYKDFGLLKNGFPAESVHNTSVLAVKTHEWGPLARSEYSKAVLVIRGPAEAIKAEFNRQSGGHVGFASPGRYKRTKGKYWEQFVADKLWAWESFNMDWGRNFSGPLRIIFYEHLIKHVATELRELLNFLEVSVDEKLLACALDRQEGIYRRNRPKEPYDPYTEDMKRALAARKEVVYKELGGPLYSSDVNAYDTVKIHVHN